MRDPKVVALNYLQSHQVVSLATHGSQGLWSAAVFYASVEFDLIFLSAGHTRHAQNIASQPHVAATIQEDYKDWPSIKGIQMEGVVEQLADVPRETAIAHYLAKFPNVKADPRLSNALDKVNWYRLRPTQLYFIDNSLGLGHRDAINVAHF